ncbi:MAG: hypothetical protein EBR07_00065 [Planctomycetes bacterium]|nr:hypothetical protein [Planctomycetota bacterium]
MGSPLLDGRLDIERRNWRHLLSEIVYARFTSLLPMRHCRGILGHITMHPKLRKRNPFELPDQHSPNGDNDGSPLLGDMVARATKAVGIKPCAPCAQRQAALNRATPGWVGKILSWFKR